MTPPYCTACRTPLTGQGPCLYCRAVAAETKLARLSVWGEDEWMQRLASIALDPPPREGLVPLGLQGDLPSNGHQLQVHTYPQVPFRPEMLTVAPDCAFLGALTDVQVGNTSQLIDATPIPLSVFSPAHWADIEMMHRAIGHMRWDVAHVAVRITLLIDLTLPAYEPLVETANLAMGMPPRATKFRAALWGRTMREAPRTLLDTVPGIPGAVGVADIDDARRAVQFADLVNDIRKGYPTRR